MRPAVRQPNSALNLTRRAADLLGGPSFGHNRGMRKRYISPDVQVSVSVRRPAEALLKTMAFVLIAVLTASGSTAEEPQFEHLAEGYTSATRTSGIEAGYRMFTVPWSRENCPGFPRVAKLLLSGAPPQLTVDKWFPFDHLAIVALDPSENLLPPTPIVIEVELVHPPVLNLQNHMLAEPRVLPLREGQSRFRVSTFCQEQPATLVFQACVVKQ